MNIKSIFSPLIVFFLIGCQQQSIKQKLNIACAANMQYAVDSVAVLFEKAYNVKTNTTFNSSGMLYSQIELGAPFDLFISADTKYPNTLYKKKLVYTPITYAKGQLILVGHKDEFNFTSLENVLNNFNTQRIACADRELAPYGIATQQSLERSGFLSDISAKIIMGESISQVNQYLESRAVDLAFTSKSFAVINKDKFDFLEIDHSLYDPIYQSAAVIASKDKEGEKTAELFLNFLSSSKCKAVLNHFGYQTDL